MNHTFTNTIGIDVSKEKLDVHDYKLNKHQEFKNSLEGYQKLVLFAKNNQASQLQQVVFCFENSGLYSLPLCVFMEENKLPYTALPALEIKRSIGIARGKADKIDAYKIAHYAYLRRENLPLTKLPPVIVLKLKELLSLRARMVKQRAGYQGYLKELSRFSKSGNHLFVFACQDKLIQELTKQIDAAEKELVNLIETDPHLKQQFNLVKSVKGVGLIVASSLLVYTDGFTKFSSWRQFASYVGTAPFSHESGSSIRSAKRVSSIANKRLKALLSSAAVSSVQDDAQMRLYFDRRVKDGKSKMSVYNIVKNKILARVFAVVNRHSPYVDTLRYAA